MIMKKILLYEEDSELLHTLIGVIEECVSGIEIITAVDYVTACKMIKMYNMHAFLLDLDSCREKAADSVIDFGKYIRSLPQYRYTPIVFLILRADI